MTVRIEQLIRIFNKKKTEKIVLDDYGNEKEKRATQKHYLYVEDRQT